MTKNFRLCGRLALLWLLFAMARPADTIRCWEVSCRLPVYDQQGRVDTSVTLSRRLYMDDDLMMYEYGKSQYFIFNKDSLVGLRYDDLRPERSGPFRVDSLRQMMTPYLTHFGLFKKGFGRLVSSASYTQAGLLKETYCDINFRRHPNTDSGYVTYSDRFDFLPRDISLDYALDSLYQKRLCEVRIVMSASWDQATGMITARSEWIFRLQEVNDFNRDTIQSYFSRYRQEGARGRGRYTRAIRP